MWKQRCKRIENGSEGGSKGASKGGNEGANEDPPAVGAEGHESVEVLQRLDRKVIDLIKQAGIQKCRATEGRNKDGSGGSTRRGSQMDRKLKRYMKLR